MAEQHARVLTVMAHPDDVEILVGGMLLHLTGAGWEAAVITMTAGDCGSSETPSKDEISRIRYAEAEASAASIGARYACAGLADVEVFANAESVRRVVELLRTFVPDVVITHSPSDYMLDHEETARIVRGAVFAGAMPLYQTRHAPPAAPLPSTPALYYADPVEGLDPMGRRVYPDFYIDISEQIEGKRKLLAHHVSQRAWLRRQHGVDEYLERMTEWAAIYGRECGVAHAEGFRQHLGHGYPREPRLQDALKSHLRTRTDHRAGLLDRDQVS
ncbi:MAG: PIG-L family deacetylase [Luteitalea sp.]|nr:PIG-L family deacetylase [Luteitalea sp.]